MTPYYSDDWLTILEGDCREVMATMEPESVHCVVTSPPYWGLRDYGTATWVGGDEGCDHSPLGAPRATRPASGLAGGKATVDAGTVRKGGCGKCGAIREDSQLGLEPTPEAYVENMVAVFREVRRVLRADGTVWLNLGDSYAGGGGFSPDSPSNLAGSKQTTQRGSIKGRIRTGNGLKPKDLVGIPWRVAFALQADGWYLRSDIIWSKPNPMPESVTDRPTKAHEYLFLLSKSPRYYYDADAVREPDAGTDHPRVVLDGQASLEPSGGLAGAHRGIRTVDGRNGSGRNLRSVWTVATQPYPGAHFATFPEKLLEPCILAGTSAKGVCPECGAPWVRETELDPAYAAGVEYARERRRSSAKSALADEFTNLNHGSLGPGAPRSKTTLTTGWKPGCTHAGTGRSEPAGPVESSLGFVQPESVLAVTGQSQPPIPATVLDPFAGSGTVGRVAARLSRRAVLIDLNAAYLGQAMKRNDAIPLGLETA